MNSPERPFREGRPFFRPESEVPSDLRQREFTLRAQIEALEGQVIDSNPSHPRERERERKPVRVQDRDRYQHRAEVELHDHIEFQTRARGQSRPASRKGTNHFHRFLWLCAILAGLAVWLLMKG